MKSIAAFSACALLALSAPAFAQSHPSPKTEMLRNGSVNGSGPSHAKQKGAPDTESGASKGLIEGRSSATDNNGATPKMGGSKMQKGSSGETGTSGAAPK